LPRSPIKPKANLIDTWRDAVRAQAWIGLGIWIPALAGWLLLYWGATNMDSPVAQLTMPMSEWSAANWLAVFIMWAVMMGAMMLPTTVPMATCFAMLNRRRDEGARTLVFVAAYLALWTAFGAAATAAQWALQTTGWVSPMIVSMSPLLTGTLLLIAGVFQFSGLKQACLRACRSPLGFLITDWRDGLWGAWRMGIRHGVYCLGCCWALMALLFVGGAMNLLWISALTLLVAIEKLAPRGEVIAKALGAVMIGAGLARLVWQSS
jgi:predicted metal-binding membrane protein